MIKFRPQNPDYAFHFISSLIFHRHWGPFDQSLETPNISLLLIQQKPLHIWAQEDKAGINIFPFCMFSTSKIS